MRYDIMDLSLKIKACISDVTPRTMLGGTIHTSTPVHFRFGPT